MPFGNAAVIIRHLIIINKKKSTKHLFACKAMQLFRNIKTKNPKMQPFPSVVVRTQTSSSLFLMQIPHFSTRFFFRFKKKDLPSPWIKRLGA